MAKVKTLKFPVEWEDDGKGNLVGKIAQGASSIQITEELVNIPIDVPNLKSTLCTKSITISFPKEGFAEERKEDVSSKISELYPEWKVTKADNGDLVVTPTLESTQTY